MITAALVGLLCGAAVGSKFRVMALLPFEALALLIGLVAVLTSDMTLTNAGGAFVCWSVGLQLGYVARICWNIDWHAFHPSFATRVRPARKPT